jgi:hypothetical protein
LKWHETENIRAILLKLKPYFITSMAAKISFMRLTLLSVLCNPSLVSFLILLIKIVYHTKRLKGMKINVDGMKMGHLTKLIAQFYQTTEVMILLKSNDLIQQL